MGIPLPARTLTQIDMLILGTVKVPMVSKEYRKYGDGKRHDLDFSILRHLHLPHLWEVNQRNV